MNKELCKTPLKETLGTLTPASRKLVNWVTESARDMFGQKGKVEPCFFFVNEKGETTIMETNMPDTDEEKEALFAKARLLRSRVPLSAFVTEVWMGHIRSGKDEPAPKRLPDGSYALPPGYVRPSQDPNRTESVMLTVWEGRRTICIHAAITRNPTKLGEWHTFNDSQFAEKNETVVGRAIDGNALPLEDN